MTGTETGGRGVESLGDGLLTRTRHHFPLHKSTSPKGAVVPLGDHRDRKRLERVATALHAVTEDERAPLWAAFDRVARDPHLHQSLRAMARAGADALDGLVERGDTVEDTMATLDRAARAELERLATRGARA